MEDTRNTSEIKKFSDSNGVESESVTFDPSWPTHVSCFLRPSPATVTTGGTHARKSFVTITSSAKGGLWL